MNKQEIENYNRLCAEFLGWIKYQEIFYRIPVELQQHDGISQDIPLEGLVFHSDWNWIIEVVEAIERIGETSNKYGVLVDITTTHVRIGNFLVDLKLTPMPKKEAIVQAINQFLIWYNEQTN